MKRLICLFVALSAVSLARTQEGQYKGIVNLGPTTLSINFKLQEVSGGWNGEAEIPAQGQTLELADIKIDSDSIRFSLKDVPGNATAVLARGEDTLNGTFSQSGQKFEYEAWILKEDPNLPQKLAKLDTLTMRFMDSLKVVGLSFGIVHNGKVILSKGYGYRDLEKKEVADENTVFAIGSTSKAFTALMLSQCVEDELIEWDEPVRSYLPGFGMKDPVADAEINPEDLLTHRSGLPRHDLMWYGSGFTRQELLERIKYLEPTAPFRTQWQYQNLMYMTAGILAGKLRDKTWEELLQTQILDPLKMTRTKPDFNWFTKELNASKPYAVKDGGIIKMEYRNIDQIGPAGSINSTCVDMLKWTSMLLGRGKVDGQAIVSEQAVKDVLKPRIVMSTSIRDKRFTEFLYGMGWMMNYYDGKKVVKHGGNIDGFSALVYMMPTEDLGVVLLTNQNGSALNDLLAQYATDIILDMGDTEWYDVYFPNGAPDWTAEEEDENKASKDKQGPYHELKSYLGTYEDEGYGQIKIQEKEGKLTMDFNSFSYDLEHLNMEVFQAYEPFFDSKQKVVFRSDLNGDVIYLEVSMEATLDPVKFYRTFDVSALGEEFYTQFVGRYEMPDLVVEIVYADGALWAEAPGAGKFEIVPSDWTKFKLEGLSGYSIEFIQNKKGEVTGLISHQPDGDHEGKRVED